MLAPRLSPLLLALLLSGPAHALVPQDMEVRVRIKKNLRVVELSGTELTIIPASGVVPLAMPNSGISEVKITLSPKGYWVLRWTDTGVSERLETEVLNVRAQTLRVGVDPVPYNLRLVPNGGRIDVIARLDLETYLSGVLPSEMPIAWPLEALKAQAVAARSFALRRAKERKSKNFDVESSVIDQAYKFLHEAEDHPEWKSKLNRAITETRGQILVDHNSRVLKAFYSADCGCQTEDPKFVWGKVESFESVKDPTCKNRKASSWEITMDRVEVRQKLLAALELPPDSRLRALHVGSRTPSGRVSEVVASLEVNGKVTSQQMTAQDFRRVVGFHRVRSTDFSLRWLADQLTITGTGMGHGVGMCQTGARDLAEEGSTYKDILKFYYPRASLKLPKSA